MQLITREPIGIVACIIPFNFPCDLYDQKVAPALMMGNAAIVLPSSDNPLTLMKLTEMLVEAGLVTLKNNGGIKVLGDGQISKKLTVRADKFSASAKSAIEAAGGAAEVIE